MYHMQILPVLIPSYFLRLHREEEIMTQTKEEKFKINGEDIIKKVKELIAEGNVRKITITDRDGKVLVVFPLSVGVVGVVLAPVLAAVGAIAALVAECTITVEREEN